MRRNHLAHIACAPFLLLAPAAAAQEVLNMPSATQPAAGHFTVRPMARFTRYEDDPTTQGRTARETRADLIIAYGITGELSASATLPFTHRRTTFADGSTDANVGLADPTILFKWRFWKEDLGPIDTIRTSLLFGAELPLGDGVYTSGSVDPIVGVAMTTIRGRHGLGASVQYTLTTDGDSEPLTFGHGLADAIRADASYAFRIDPAEYESDTPAATYAVLELNTRFETNGDREVFLSPGLLYEARTWAAEFGAQIPVERSLDHRPKVDYALVLGIRILF